MPKPGLHGVAVPLGKKQSLVAAFHVQVTCLAWNLSWFWLSKKQFPSLKKVAFHAQVTCLAQNSSRFHSTLFSSFVSSTLP
jgi:hypothetical protein